MAEEEKEEREEEEERRAGMTEEELKEKLQEHFRKQKVDEMLVQFMISLSTMAYVKMGLTDEDRSHRDFAQSQLAIDSFKAILDAVGGRLGKQDAEALAGALASMQMTFAKAAGGAGGGPSETGKGEGKEPGGESGPASRIWVPGKE